MEVYQFDKSMRDRLEEAQNVFSSKKLIPASRVLEEWSYNVEILIEPTGKLLRGLVFQCSQVFSMFSQGVTK